MIRTVQVSMELVSETLANLRAAGERRAEGIVLWLAKPASQRLLVVDILVPLHEAELDYFRIPQNGMDALMSTLRSRRVMVAAQVHSHPAEAFHSPSDDKWAIVRHENALSIVVPYFATGATAHEFMRESATFALARDGKWRKVAGRDLEQLVEVTP